MICKKCDKEFKTLIVIEGKQRNLGTRKFCLDCSPFGLHNTKKLDTCNDSSVCKVCSKEFVPDRSKGHRKDRCGTCITSTRHKQIKLKALLYKGSKCVKCSYDKCVEALHFHHLEPEHKDFTVGGSYNRKWEVIEKELDKCILLCANCHAETHSSSLNVEH